MSAEPIDFASKVREKEKGRAEYVFFDKKNDGSRGALRLAEPPKHDDLPGLLKWIGGVLQLDSDHPVREVARQGRRGPDGHVVIRRVGAPDIRFEPERTLQTARTLSAAIIPQLLPTDGQPWSFKDEHARTIAWVIRLAYGVCSAPDAAQETAGIVSTFLQRASALEGHSTYGPTEERHAAVEALRSDHDSRTAIAVGHARYLVDAATGELVIRVSDLAVAAREYLGSSVAHGFLDARMQDLGWERAALQGFAEGGRAGRKGSHARCDVFRGFLPRDEADEGSDEGSVNT